MKQTRSYTLIKHLFFTILIGVVATLSQVVAQENNQTLDADSLISDIDLLGRMLDEVHPGTYRYLTRAQLDESLNRLKEQASRGLTEQQFYIKLSQLVAQVKCGHTYLNPWNMKRSVRERMFGKQQYLPMGLTIVGDRIYVTENVSGMEGLKRGAEMLSMNGYATQAILDSLRTVTKQDGNNDASFAYCFSIENYNVRSHEAFDRYFMTFFLNDEITIPMTFRNNGSTKVQTAEVTLMTKKDREEAMASKYGEEILSTEQWKLRFINDDVAQLHLGTFATWNWKDFNHKQWLKDAFGQIEEKGVQHLIVDIRGNGGGLDDPRDELLSYLIKEKISWTDNRRVLVKTTKLDASLQPYISTWEKKLLSGIPQSYYTQYDDEYFQLAEKTQGKDVKPNKNAFKGTVWLFGNGSNTSATATIFQLAKKYEFAKVVGGNAGGNLQGINGGSYAFFTMPYSQVEVDIPLKYFQPTTPQPDQGVQPDVYVNYKQGDLATDTDAYVQKVLESIQE